MGSWSTALPRTYQHAGGYRWERTHTQGSRIFPPRSHSARHVCSRLHLHMQSGVRSGTHVWERTGAGLPARKERLCGTDVTHIILGLRGCRSVPPPLGLKTGAAPYGDSPIRPTSTPNYSHRGHLKCTAPETSQVTGEPEQYAHAHDEQELTDEHELTNKSHI